MTGRRNSSTPVLVRVHPDEEQPSGVLAAEDVAGAPGTGRVSRSTGSQRRRHVGEVGEDDEPGQGSPPVGRELVRGEHGVVEHRAEEGMEREAQSGIQSINVHAYGSGRRSRKQIKSRHTQIHSLLAQQHCRRRIKIDL